MIQRIREYLASSWSELKKVSWPTPEQTRNLTVLVFAASFVVGAFIAAFDFLFGEAVRIMNAV